MARTPRGARRFEEVARLDVQGLDHEHPRSLPKTPTGTQSYVCEESEELEDRKQRARAIAQWIEDQAAERTPPMLFAFVSPKLLPEVRKRLSVPVRDYVELISCELAQLDEIQLADHPALQGKL